MTPALRQFLADWLAWAEAGAPEHPAFKRCWALCANAHRWGGYAVHDELRAIVGAYPRPFGDEQDYWERVIDGTQHENPARLAWVRQQLGVEG